MADKKQIQDKQNSVKEPPRKDSNSEPQSQTEAKKQKKSADDSAAKPGANLLEKLEALTEIIKGNLDEIVPDAAIKIVDDWQGLLQKSSEPELKEIASGLKELQKLLKRDEANRHDLGELLSQLGAQTSDVSTEADKVLKLPLQQLGKQLSKSGRSLGKADDRQQLEAVDELVDLLDDKPSKIEPKAAVTEIERWYELLNKSEEPPLKEIASELKQLKQLLKGNKVKSDEVSAKLIQIGELTTAAAADAGRGFKGAVQKIGKGLTKFGKSLA